MQAGQPKSETSPNRDSRLDWISRKGTNQLFAGLGLLLCVYLIFPAFNSVHLEGFTAQTQSIALLKSVAPRVEHDPYLPLVSQFIYQTRSAVVDALSLVYGFFPNAGDRAYRGLVLVSLAVLLASSLVFARRWGNTLPLFALFALMLTPGIPETAFFFNDNIVSAAIATTALALISGKPHKLAWMLSGICFAFAILSRLDAVLVLPILLGTVLYAYDKPRDRLLACLIGCLSALLVLIASAIGHGFSLLDAVSTAQMFVVSLNDPNRWYWVRFLFFGLATLPLLMIGGWLGWLSLRRLPRQRATIGIATFIVYPIGLAALAPRVTELRYILPLLAPLIAMHAGAGLQWVYAQCIGGKGSPARYAWAVAALIAVVLVFPPTLVKMYDGPRSILGRIWSPARWASWQDGMHESLNRTGQLVALLSDGQQNVVVTTHYNDEFFVRLRLMEAGFLPAPASSRYPHCNGISLFTKDAAIVVHIRTDPQYRIAKVNVPYNAALQISAAFSCPAVGTSGKTYITAVGNYEQGLSPDVYSFSVASFQGPAAIEFSDARDLVSTKDLSIYRKHGLLMYRQLTSGEIAATLEKARRHLTTATAATASLDAAGEAAAATVVPGAATVPEPAAPSSRGMTIEEYAAAYRSIPGPTSEFLSTLSSAN